MAGSKGYTPRVNHGGNYCGHDPKNPRFDVISPPAYGGILAKACQRLIDFYWNPALLPCLGFLHGRKQRSERRRAEVIVMLVILKYLDLATLRCGIPTADGFMPLTVTWIAKQCKMTLRRVERVLHDLRLAGILTSHQYRRRKDDGSYEVFAAVRRVNVGLFLMLGIATLLVKEERDAAVDRLRKKAAKTFTTLADWTRARFTVGKLVDKVVQRSSTSSNSTTYRATGPPGNATALVLQLKHLCPDWSIENIFAEAKRQLSP